MKLRILFTCLFISSTVMVFPQVDPEINQTDKDGKKQGRWIKEYPGGNVMYDGFFRDDQPEGEFKRYYENKTLKSVLVFSKNGTEAIASLYYPNGFPASKGKYINQLKEGKWQFFSEQTSGALISEEEFSKNLREGISIKYYSDSTVAEKIYYTGNIKNGEWLRYYPDGTLNLRTSFTNGKINGKFEAYFENGKTEFSGFYKYDLKDGLWKIYNPGGSIKYEIEYALGETKNRVLDIQQSEYIDSLEKNRMNIADPEKNPGIWQ